MSKEVIRFFGALLIIGSLGGAYLGIESLQEEVTRLEGRVDTSKRLDSELVGLYKEQLRKAEDEQDDKTPVFKVMGGIGAVAGLFLLMVAPGSTRENELSKQEGNT